MRDAAHSPWSSRAIARGAVRVVRPGRRGTSVRAVRARAIARSPAGRARGTRRRPAPGSHVGDGGRRPPERPLNVVRLIAVGSAWRAARRVVGADRRAGRASAIRAGGAPRDRRAVARRQRLGEQPGGSGHTRSGRPPRSSARTRAAMRREPDGHRVRPVGSVRRDRTSAHSAARRVLPASRDTARGRPRPARLRAAVPPRPLPTPGQRSLWSSAGSGTRSRSDQRALVGRLDPERRQRRDRRGRRRRRAPPRAPSSASRGRHGPRPAVSASRNSSLAQAPPSAKRRPARQVKRVAQAVGWRRSTRRCRRPDCRPSLPRPARGVSSRSSDAAPGIGAARRDRSAGGSARTPTRVRASRWLAHPPHAASSAPTQRARRDRRGSGGRMRRDQRGGRQRDRGRASLAARAAPRGNPRGPRRRASLTLVGAAASVRRVLATTTDRRAPRVRDGAGASRPRSWLLRPAVGRLSLAHRRGRAARPSGCWRSPSRARAMPFCDRPAARSRAARATCPWLDLELEVWDEHEDPFLSGSSGGIRPRAPVRGPAARRGAAHRPAARGSPRARAAVRRHVAAVAARARQGRRRARGARARAPRTRTASSRRSATRCARRAPSARSSRRRDRAASRRSATPIRGRSSRRVRTRALPHHHQRPTADSPTATS